MIEAQNIDFWIDDAQILFELSLKISPKEIVAIVGESGSGKTTLLKLLAALKAPTNGKVMLDGENLDIFSSHLIKGHPAIKLVAQDFELFPNLTVAENISYSIRNYTVDYQVARLFELLKICQLEKVKDRLPKQISGGEKQRTAIAKAIADEPKVLLLDEPFSQLDSIHKASLKLILQRLIEIENIACVFVTHDLIDAISLANKIGFMKDGRLIEVIQTENLIENTKNEYVNEFIKAALEPLKYLANKLKLNQI